MLWKEAGCTTELDYTEQTSWLLFLKYLNDLEQERSLEAELVGKPYTFLLEGDYRWSSWAAPKLPNGELDHDHALIGDDLIDFVNTALFPYLQGFKQRFDVILANPPVGGKGRKEVQQNFPIKTGETAFLFLQHFIKMLKVGGRAAVVIKNTLAKDESGGLPA